MVTNAQPYRAGYDREHVNSELTRLFGHERFAGKQEEVIAQIMSGVDTIAVMPTGAGKSLCYQLPGLLRDDLTRIAAEPAARSPGTIALALAGLLAAAAVAGILNQALGSRFRGMWFAPSRGPLTRALTR